MLKNVAGQDIGAQMITAADGTAFTSAVTVYVTVESVTQAVGTVGSGACTHEGNGYHSYQPSQAETNGDHVAYTFIGTGAIPSTIQVFTDAAYDRLGAPAGASVSADIADVPTVSEFNARSLASADYTVVSDLGTVQTGDSFALIGTAGVGLTNLGGSSNNWNVGKTGYTVSTVSDKTGYSLTATTGLGNQTANITGNLSGSVGSVTAEVTADAVKFGGAAVTATTSVTIPAASTLATTTGAVGSVTGAVGSVTGHTNQTGDTYALANGTAGFVAIDTVVDAVKVQTDKMVFTKTNELDVNTKSINDAEVIGDGNATPWDGI